LKKYFYAFFLLYIQEIEVSNEIPHKKTERVLSLDKIYLSDDNKSIKDMFNPFLNAQISSKPTVARRNSGNRNKDDDYLNHIQQKQQHQQYQQQTVTDNFEETNRKYVTMPNIRTSAKSRKKLDKLFSLKYDEKQVDMNASVSKTTRTDRTDQYSESGVFSISDYGQQLDQKSTSRRYADHVDQTSDYSSLTNESPFNTKPKLLRSNSKPKLNTSSATSQQSSQGTVVRQHQQQQQQQNDVEIIGKKLNTNSPTIQFTHNTNSIEVSRKKAAALRSLNSSSPQLANNSTNNDELNKDDSLDIVGKGLFYQNQISSGDSVVYNFDDEVLDDQQNEIASDFPLSLSFQSRLRQKTQEKIEEKQRKKSDRLKQKHKQYSSEASTEHAHLQSDNPIKISDFGLSISGYGNQPANQNENEFQKEIVQDTSRHNSKPNNDYFEFADEKPSNDDQKLPLLEQNVFHRPPVNYSKSSRSTLRSKSLQRKNTILKTKPSSEEFLNDELANQGISGVLKEDFVKEPFKNPEASLKDAMRLIAQDDDWEKKCHAMNMIRRLTVYHEDLVVINIHSIVVALLQEVRNLRSQVSRFALTAFGDLFTNLKRYMDIDLDIAVKAILQKNGESSDFIRSDVERCLEKAIQNVTTHKALVALINGGASHRNPLVRKTAAQFVYKCCELMGPGKVLSGIKDVTERVLITASQFVVDGPPDIRWYGRRIFHMLMSHDEFDKMCLKYLSDSTRKNIKEILDSIRVKGPGDVPSESARFSRKGLRNGFDRDPISKSAGSTNNHVSGSSGGTVRYDMHTQESIKAIIQQLRNPDFRERIEAIERFQILCETETDIAVTNIVPVSLSLYLY
jgi:hypothetical protein